eukprot:gene93-2346_t
MSWQSGMASSGTEKRAADMDAPANKRPRTGSQVGEGSDLSEREGQDAEMSGDQGRVMSVDQEGEATDDPGGVLPIAGYVKAGQVKRDSWSGGGRGSRATTKYHIVHRSTKGVLFVRCNDWEEVRSIDCITLPKKSRICKACKQTDPSTCIPPSGMDPAMAFGRIPWIPSCYACMGIRGQEAEVLKCKGCARPFHLRCVGLPPKPASQVGAPGGPCEERVDASSLSRCSVHTDGANDEVSDNSDDDDEALWTRLARLHERLSIMLLLIVAPAASCFPLITPLPKRDGWFIAAPALAGDCLVGDKKGQEDVLCAACWRPFHLECVGRDCLPSMATPKDGPMDGPMGQDPPSRNGQLSSNEIECHLCMGTKYCYTTYLVCILGLRAFACSVQLGVLICLPPNFLSEVLMLSHCARAEQGDLLCDRCDKPFHLACLGLSKVPAGEWICPLHIEVPKPKPKPKVKGKGRNQAKAKAHGAHAQTAGQSKTEGPPKIECVDCAHLQNDRPEGPDGSTVLCCIECRQPHHLHCIGLDALPPGTDAAMWYCRKCSGSATGTFAWTCLACTGHADTQIKCIACLRDHPNPLSGGQEQKLNQQLQEMHAGQTHVPCDKSLLWCRQCNQKIHLRCVGPDGDFSELKHWASPGSSFYWHYAGEASSLYRWTCPSCKIIRKADNLEPDGDPTYDHRLVKLLGSAEAFCQVLAFCTPGVVNQAFMVSWQALLCTLWHIVARETAGAAFIGTKSKRVKVTQQKGIRARLNPELMFLCSGLMQRCREYFGGFHKICIPRSVVNKVRMEHLASALAEKGHSTNITSALVVRGPEFQMPEKWWVKLAIQNLPPTMHEIVMTGYRGRITKMMFKHIGQACPN